MNSQTLIQFAKEKQGTEILTAGERAKFSVEACENKLEFVLESGSRRQESFPWVQKFCDSFQEHKSLHPSDYPETRNASYLIGLARDYQKESKFS
jgi:hypothetical protein